MSGKRLRIRSQFLKKPLNFLEMARVVNFHKKRVSALRFYTQCEHKNQFMSSIKMEMRELKLNSWRGRLEFFIFTSFCNIFNHKFHY